MVIAEDHQIKPDVINIEAMMATMQQKMVLREQWGAPGPPINAVFNGHRMVAVHNVLVRFPQEATYHDFLRAYIEQVFGEVWWTEELEKPTENRHQVILWSVAATQYRLQNTTSEVGVQRAPMSADSAHFLRLAYNLHQIKHQGLLQDSLIKRLKNPEQFQGACYEVDVTAAFVRGGFDVALEPEGKSPDKVCEFVATHQATKKAYSVEAKSRHISGVLGQPESEGAIVREEPHVSRLIRKALKKEALHDRVICIDVNYPERLGSDMSWGPAIRKQTSELEADGCGPAILIFSNFPFHYLNTGEVANGHSFMLKSLSEPRFQPNDMATMSKVFPGLIDVMKGFQRPVPGQWE